MHLGNKDCKAIFPSGFLPAQGMTAGVDNLQTDWNVGMWVTMRNPPLYKKRSFWYIPAV